MLDDYVESRSRRARRNTAAVVVVAVLACLVVAFFFAYALAANAGYSLVSLVVGHLTWNLPVELEYSPRYLFVFGDSYTATGFNVSLQPQPSKAYPLGNSAKKDGRQSGGHIWLDTVVESSVNNITLAYNFAVGGNEVNATRMDANGEMATSRIYDFRGQQAELEMIHNSRTTGWNAHNSVSISWFGINDVAVQMYDGRHVDEIISLMRNDIGDYYKLLDRQYQMGIKRFVTVLVPPLYRAPIFGYGTADKSSDLRRATKYWNDEMRIEHEKFEHERPDIKTAVVDPAPPFNQVLDNPLDYGAPNSTCVSYPDGHPCLWHDFIHPGTVVQAEFGKHMTRVVDEMFS